MPIENIPFTRNGDDIHRPYLYLKITNTHTGKYLNTVGLVDTGADDCALPASFALILGHDLARGGIKSINTGNGVTTAYSHMTKFEILDPNDNKVLYTIQDTPVDCLPNLNIVLLGAAHFLNNFILTVNYPEHTFSIKLP